MFSFIKIKQMSQITEYKVVMGITPNDLVSQINDLINEGWIPTGGVTILQSPVTKEIGGGLISNETNSFQAMVKLKIYNL